MKPSVIAMIVLALAGFVGAVVWSTVQGAEVECEVCLVFDGQETCRSGRGPTETEALAAAQQSACGGNTANMAEAIACLNRVPDRASCPAN
jgi:hypothetical protein